ncbi:MAG: ankyrin repeat domain-containing protein [Alphaproteobacteria bacterium]|nr:ankyrin repeat domain-containing protein [Alphaproteobacteria bacterium]
MKKSFLVIVFFVPFFIMVPRVRAQKVELVQMLAFEKMICGNAGNFCSPFWWRQADIAAVQKEIEKGADLNRVDPMGKTPLMTAILLKKDPSIIRLMIEKGADPNYVSPDGKSVLMSAFPNEEMMQILFDAGVKADRNLLVKYQIVKPVSAVKLLIKNGADINARDEYGETLLKKSAHYIDLETAETLLALGADIRTKNNFGETVVSSAVTNKDIRVVKFLLDKGAVAYINTKSGFDERTPLMIASFAQSPEMIELLLQYGADVNAADKNGETALMQAVDNPAVVRVLVNRGADVNTINRNGENALTKALVRMKKYNLPALAETVEILKKTNVNMNVKNKDGVPALSLAFTKPEELKQLLETGADPNLRDNQGRTALMKSTYPVQVKSIELLLKHGADPNVTDNKGMTPLMIQRGSPEAVALLVNTGAKINAREKFGRTALFYSVMSNQIKSVKALLERGADPNIPDAKGMTPLMVTALNGYAECAELLLQGGAVKTINAKDDKGETALAKAKNAEIAALLKRYGAQK